MSGEEVDSRPDRDVHGLRHAEPSYDRGVIYEIREYTTVPGRMRVTFAVDPARRAARKTDGRTVAGIRRPVLPPAAFS